MGLGEAIRQGNGSDDEFDMEDDENEGSEHEDEDLD